MSNILWFYGVSIIGLGMTIFTLFKKRDFFTTSLVFLLTVSLLTIGEFIVLTVFDAYAYKPGVFMDSFADNVVGYILGNYFIWVGAANLVVNFSLGNRWIFLISVAFMLIEILFLDLGIYEHHWWKTYMTGILVFLGLNITKKWVYKLNEKPYEKMILQYITFFLFALVFIHVPTHPLLLAGKLHYSVGWVENFYRDSILFGLPYHAGMSAFYVFFCNILQNRLWKLAPIILFLVGDFILVYMNILMLLDNWSFVCMEVLRTISLMLFALYTSACKSQWH